MKVRHSNKEKKGEGVPHPRCGDFFVTNKYQ